MRRTWWIVTISAFAVVALALPAMARSATDPGEDRIEVHAREQVMDRAQQHEGIASPPGDQIRDRDRDRDRIHAEDGCDGTCDADRDQRRERARAQTREGDADATLRGYAFRHHHRLWDGAQWCTQEPR